MPAQPISRTLREATTLTRSPQRVLIVAALLERPGSTAAELMTFPGVPTRSTLLLQLRALAQDGFITAREGTREVHPADWRGRRLTYTACDSAVNKAITTLRTLLSPSDS